MSFSLSTRSSESLPFPRLYISSIRTALTTRTRSPSHLLPCLCVSFLPGVLEIGLMLPGPENLLTIIGARGISEVGPSDATGWTLIFEARCTRRDGQVRCWKPKPQVDRFESGHYCHFTLYITQLCKYTERIP
ncbi:hypothetical protein RSAG8_13789, partial [Rhizoctonia solani AG-8 WAC10335]